MDYPTAKPPLVAEQKYYPYQYSILDYGIVIVFATCLDAADAIIKQFVEYRGLPAYLFVEKP